MASTFVHAAIMRFVRPLLATFVDEESLAAGLFSFEDGALQLHDVALSQSLLASLELPVAVRRAVISTLRLHLGVSALLGLSGGAALASAAGAPVRVRLELRGLHVLASLATSVPGERRVAADLAALDAAIRAALGALAEDPAGFGGSASASAEAEEERRDSSLADQKRSVGKGALMRIISRLAEGVTVEVSDLHVRIEAGGDGAHQRHERASPARTTAAPAASPTPASAAADVTASGSCNAASPAGPANLNVGIVLSSLVIRSGDAPGITSVDKPSETGNASREGPISGAAGPSAAPSLSFVRKAIELRGLAVYCDAAPGSFGFGSGLHGPEFSEQMRLLIDPKAFFASRNAALASQSPKVVAAAAASSATPVAAHHSLTPNNADSAAPASPASISSLSTPPPSASRAQRSPAARVETAKRSVVANSVEGLLLSRRYILAPLNIFATIVLNDSGFPPPSELHLLLRADKRLDSFEEDLANLIPQELPASALSALRSEASENAFVDASAAQQLLHRQWAALRRDPIAFLAETFVQGRGGERAADGLRTSYAEGHRRFRAAHGRGALYSPASADSLIQADKAKREDVSTESAASDFSDTALAVVGPVVAFFRRAHLDSPALLEIAGRFERVAAAERPPSFEARVELDSLLLSVSNVQLRGLLELGAAVSAPPKLRPTRFDVETVAARLGLSNLIGPRAASDQPVSSSAVLEQSHVQPSASISAVSLDIATLQSQRDLAARAVACFESCEEPPHGSAVAPVSASVGSALLSISELSGACARGRELLLDGPLLQRYTQICEEKLRRAHDASRLQAQQPSPAHKSSGAEGDAAWVCLAGVPLMMAMEQWLIESYCQGLDSARAALSASIDLATRRNEAAALNLPSLESFSSITFLAALGMARRSAEQTHNEEVAAAEATAAAIAQARSEKSAVGVLSRLGSDLYSLIGGQRGAPASAGAGQGQATKKAGEPAPLHVPSFVSAPLSGGSGAWDEILREVAAEQERPANTDDSNSSISGIDSASEAGTITDEDLDAVEGGLDTASIPSSRRHSAVGQEAQAHKSLLYAQRCLSSLLASQDSSSARPGDSAYLLHPLLRPFYRDDGKVDYAGALFEFSCFSRLKVVILRAGVTLLRDVPVGAAIAGGRMAMEDQSRSRPSCDRFARLRAGVLSSARSGLARELALGAVPLLRISVVSIAVGLDQNSPSVLAIDADARRAARRRRKKHVSASLMQAQDRDVHVSERGGVSRIATFLESQVSQFEHAFGTGVSARLEPPSSITLTLEIGDIDVQEFATKRGRALHLLRRHVPVSAFLSTLVLARHLDMDGAFVNVRDSASSVASSLLPPLFALRVDLGQGGVGLSLRGDVQQLDCKVSPGAILALIDFGAVATAPTLSRSDSVAGASLSAFMSMAGASAASFRATQASVDRVAAALQRLRHAVYDPPRLRLELNVRSLRLLIPSDAAAAESDMLVVVLGDTSICTQPAFPTGDTLVPGLSSADSEASAAAEVMKLCYDVISVRNSGASLSLVRAPPAGRCYVERQTRFYGEAPALLLPVSLSVDVGLARGAPEPSSHPLRDFARQRLHAHVGDVHLAITAMKAKRLIDLASSVAAQIALISAPQQTQSDIAAQAGDSRKAPQVGSQSSAIAPRTQHLAVRIKLACVRVSLSDSEMDGSEAALSTLRLPAQPLRWRGTDFARLLGPACKPIFSLAILRVSASFDSNSDGSEALLNVGSIKSWDLLRLRESGWLDFEARAAEDGTNSTSPIHPLHMCQIVSADGEDGLPFVRISCLLYPSKLHAPAAVTVDADLGRAAVVVNRDTIASVIGLIGSLAPTSSASPQAVSCPPTQDPGLQEISRCTSPESCNVASAGLFNALKRGEHPSAADEAPHLQELLSAIRGPNPTSFQLTCSVASATVALNRELIRPPLLASEAKREMRAFEALCTTSDYGFGACEPSAHAPTWRRYVFAGPLAFARVSRVFAAVAVNAISTEVSAHVGDVSVADTTCEPRSAADSVDLSGDRRHTVFVGRRTNSLAKAQIDSVLHCVEKSPPSRAQQSLLESLLLPHILSGSEAASEQSFDAWAWVETIVATGAAGCAGQSAGRSLFCATDSEALLALRREAFLLADVVVLSGSAASRWVAVPGSSKYANMSS